MITITTLLAAAALSAGAAPAAPAAAPTVPIAVAAIASPAPVKSSRYAVRYDRKRDYYCVRDNNGTPATGTMLSTEQCRSSSDWASRGLFLSRKH